MNGAVEAVTRPAPSSSIPVPAEERTEVRGSKEDALDARQSESTAQALKERVVTFTSGITSGAPNRPCGAGRLRRD